MPNPIGIAVSDAGSHAGGNLKTYTAIAIDDQFATFNHRTGGPSYAGSMAGKGLWSSIGRWWSDFDRSRYGYGFDEFLSRAHPCATDLYSLASGGLRLRSREPTEAEWTQLWRLPAMKGEWLGKQIKPWISPHISSFYAVRFKPPFVVEFDVTFPPQADGSVPFSAVWLYTCGRNPTTPAAREAEIDIEVFGDRLGRTLHDWPYHPDGDQVLHKQYDRPLTGAGKPLGAGFVIAARHTYTLEVRPWGLRLAVDGKTVDVTAWPVGFAWNQDWQVILNNSSGIPWPEQGKPYLAPEPGSPPSDMIVHSVRVLCEDERQIWRNNEVQP